MKLKLKLKLKRVKVTPVNTQDLILISSQSIFDDAVVAEKQALGIYGAYVAVFTLNEQMYGVILDGHHALKAAYKDGVEPELEVVDWFMTESEHTDCLERWLWDNKYDTCYYNFYTGDMIEEIDALINP